MKKLTQVSLTGKEKERRKMQQYVDKNAVKRRAEVKATGRAVDAVLRFTQSSSEVATSERSKGN